jgi:hypothetical protein
MMRKPVSAFYRVGGTEPRPASLIRTIDPDCSVVAGVGQPSMLKNKKTGKVYAFPAPDAAGLSWIKAYDAEVAAKMAKGRFGAPDTPHVFPDVASFDYVFAFDAFACWMTGPADVPGNTSNVLYYWIGIQDTNNMLLQPVLQSVNKETWNLQSFFVDGQSLVHESSVSDTLPAGTLTQAVITCNSASSFTSQFNSSAGAEFPATVLTVDYDFNPLDSFAQAVFEAFAPITDYAPASFLFQWVAMTAASGSNNDSPTWEVTEADPNSSTMAVTMPVPPISTEFPWRRNITVSNNPSGT